MKKNLDITKPRSSEQILPVPWPFVMLRFHCTNWGHSFYVSYWRRDRRFYIIGAKEGQGQYLHCSVVLSVSTVMVITSATSRSTVKRSTDFPWSIKKTPVKAKQTTTCWMLAWKYTVQYSALVESLALLVKLCSSRKYPYLPPGTEGNGNSEGRGWGFKKGQFRRGWGVASRVFFPGAPSKIDEQATSYFTVNRCFKAEIIIFTDDLVGWVLFFTADTTV